MLMRLLRPHEYSRGAAERNDFASAGLKLTLQTKRRVNGNVDEGRKKPRKEYGSADDEEDDESSNSKSSHGVSSSRFSYIVVG